jgi:hypothetical protein
MSDDEYYSDNNSESEDSENEEINTTIPIKFRPPNSINIQNNDFYHLHYFLFYVYQYQ